MNKQSAWKIKKLFLLSVLCIASAPSWAGVYIYPMEVSVGSKGVSQIKLISQSDSVQFVRVSLKQVVKAGTMQENEIPAIPGDSSQLVITPLKIALSAGSERVIRLVSIIPPPKETTWRAYFEGVKDEPHFDVSKDAQKKGDTASVGVNIVWGALVHVAPEKVVASLRTKINTGKVINNGTIRIPIQELGVCDVDQCQWKKIVTTVYPDTEINLPDVTFLQDKKYRVKYFNWITSKTEEIPLPVSQVN